jgi:hypothetical protein
MFKLMNKNGVIVADNIPTLGYAKRMALSLGNVYITDENNGIISFHSIEGYYKRVIMDLIAIGASVEFGKLSICCINEHHRSIPERKTYYQVVYNDYQNEYSRWFKSIKEAVDKFVELELKHESGRSN